VPAVLTALANPARFMALSRPLAPALGALAAALLAWGLWLGFRAPPDYQQGDTVLIMFVHVPAAYMGLFAYLCLGGASLAGLVWRHALADAAAKAAAPLGAAFTFLALATGSLWGKPMWGAWWVWDARLTSVLVLFLFYLGYLALHAAIEDEAKAARAAAVLALVGLVNLPIVKFSVDWWNTLHQPASVVRAGGSSLDPAFLQPLLVMAGAYTALFLSLWLVRTRAEVWRRRALSPRRAAPGGPAVRPAVLGAPS
jgi:heme exporter protein C